jgi:hypothetical protein
MDGVMPEPVTAQVMMTFLDFAINNSLLVGTGRRPVREPFGHGMGYARRRPMRSKAAPLPVM